MNVLDNKIKWLKSDSDQLFVQHSQTSDYSREHFVFRYNMVLYLPEQSQQESLSPIYTVQRLPKICLRFQSDVAVFELDAIVVS